MKKILLLFVFLASIVALPGCNLQVVDTTYNFDEAIVSLPDGTVIRGCVDSWKDFQDGDQVQVRIDGTTYLIHSSDVALIHHHKGELN